MTVRGALVILVATLAYGCGRVDPVEELAAARVEVGNGDFQTAAIRISNVLRADPDNRDAHVLRGELALAVGDYPTAAAEFERSMDLGVPAEQVALGLAKASAELEQHERALAVLDTAMSAFRDDAEYWVVRGDVAARAEMVDEARAALDRAAALGANGVPYLMARGRLAWTRGELDEAESMFKAAVAEDAASGDVYAALGELYARFERYTDAAEALTTAANLFRSNGSVLPEARVLLGLAQVGLAQNDLDAAAAAAERLAERLPQGAMASYLRGLVEYRRGRFDAAIASLQEAVNAAPDNQQFLTLLAATHLARGNLGQAELHLLRVLARNPRDPAAVKLLAETRLRQQRPEAALEALRPLAGLEAEDAQVSLLTGLANVLAGNAEQGIVYLEQASALDPGNQLLKLELAKAYSAVDRHAEAAAVLSESLEPGGSAGDIEARLLQLLAYARAGDRGSGDRAVAGLLEEHSDDPRAYVVAATYRQAVNDAQEARALLERAVEVDGAFVPARMLLAAALAQEGRIAEAEQQLEQVVAAEPGNAQALAGLAQIAAARNDLRASEELLREASRNSGSVVPRLMLAQLLIGQRRFADAGGVLEEARGIAPDNPEVIAVQGLLALAEGRSGDAASLLEAAQARMPQRVGVALALADANLRAGAPERAKAVLQNVLATAPQSLPIRAALGMVELSLGATDEALAIAKDLQAEFPQQWQGYLLEARVEIARRRYGAAADVLRVAYEQEPAWPVLTELVNALELAGRTEQALEALSSWVSREPTDVRARLTLAQALQADGRTEEALRQYEAVLDIDERNVVALNNGAWLYHQLGDARALPLAERALSVAPENPAVLDTLGTILIGLDREQDAISHLEKAAQLAPQALDIRYHLAEALVGLGRRAEARATLEGLLAEGRSFENRSAAEALLESL